MVVWIKNVIDFHYLYLFAIGYDPFLAVTKHRRKKSKCNDNPIIDDQASYLESYIVRYVMILSLCLVQTK